MTETDLRQQYLHSKVGDLAAYAGMIGSEFSSKLDRLAQIIGTSHELSVGEYKESLLKSCVRNFLPKRYSVGTGFIVFVENSPKSNIDPDNVDLANLKSHCTSHQLDVVVYDDIDYAPLFKDGDFVILRPESVRSIIEVKGYLDSKNIESCVKKYVLLGRMWKKYSDRYDKYIANFPELKKMNSLGLFLMGWNVRVNKNGQAMCSGEVLRKKIVSTYRKELTNNELKDRNIPLLNSAYIYDDCRVSAMTYINEKVHGHGYSTMRGKFVRYDNEGVPSLERDSTVWNLLSAIYIYLETPFNPDYIYFDQSITMSVCPHKHAGTTELQSGKEVEL